MKKWYQEESQKIAVRTENGKNGTNQNDNQISLHGKEHV
jgi:hypothetical protein